MEDTGAVRPRPQAGSRRRQRSTTWLRRVLIGLVTLFLALIFAINVKPAVVVVVSNDTAGGRAYLRNGSSTVIPEGDSIRMIFSSGGVNEGVRFSCVDIPQSEIRGTAYLGGGLLFDVVIVEVSGCDMILFHHFSIP